MPVIIVFFFAAVVSIAAISVLSFSFYLKRKTKRLASENQKQFNEPPVYRSLFEPSEKEMRALEIESEAKRNDTLRREILMRAEASDFNVLLEARNFDAASYEEVLSKLLEKTETKENLVSLCEFIEQNDLRASGETVRKFEIFRQKFPNKKNTIQVFHLAAKTESAEIFSETLETVIQHWREASLPQTTPENLLQLAESEFWLLPAAERTSGAGFLLKEKLSDLRRKIK